MIASPGDGQYDPTVNAAGAQQRFAEVARSMVRSRPSTSRPRSRCGSRTWTRYDPGCFESDLDRPTGLVVSQVLAELRQTDAFRGKAPGYIENGGYTHRHHGRRRAQALLERSADRGPPARS